MEEINKYVKENFGVDIGDIVPYTNTRGNIKNARITEFIKTDSKRPYWFRGTNIDTNAKVFYSLHISLELKNNH